MSEALLLAHISSVTYINNAVISSLLPSKQPSDQNRDGPITVFKGNSVWLNCNLIVNECWQLECDLFGNNCLFIGNVL